MFDQEEQKHRDEMDRLYELTLTEVTQSQLIQMFILNEHTGKFTRRVDRYGKPYHPTETPEIVNGTKVKPGSLTMVIKGRSYAYHRLVWLYLHGEMPIDRIGFIDGDKTNTRPDNLALIPEGRRSLPKQQVVSFL